MENDLIRKAYEQQGLTVSQFCSVVGVSRQTFYQWRDGKRVSPEPMLRLVNKYQPEKATSQMAMMAGTK